MKRIYLEGGYDQVIEKAIGKDKINYAMWKFPEVDEKQGIKLTHWSYFEPWDSYRNYLVAKEHCGLEEKRKGKMIHSQTCPK